MYHHNQHLPFQLSGGIRKVVTNRFSTKQYRVFRSRAIGATLAAPLSPQVLEI